MGTLAILDRLDVVQSDTLCWWLCERQLPNGGLNGRPEKLEDVSLLLVHPPTSSIKWILMSVNIMKQVCYSWWALASLAILGRSHWIDGSQLSKFILSAQVSESFTHLCKPDIQLIHIRLRQDEEKGGIADRPEDVADVWHTFFGIAGSFRPSG